MSSPQVENGFTRISNEILEAFARTPSLGSEAFQVLSLVLRYTYGFQKKKAEMAITFIQRGTGMKHANVVRAVKRLVSKRILAREGSSIEFNKNYEQWLVSKRIPSIQTDTPPVSKRIQKAVSKRIPNKERDKENLIKEKDMQRPDVAKDGITKIFEKFQMNLNPTINYGNKTQRSAADWLAKQYGTEKVIRTIDYLETIRDDPYSPTITTPYQLKEKFAQLMAYYRKQEAKTKKNQITIID